MTIKESANQYKGESLLADSFLENSLMFMVDRSVDSRYNRHRRSVIDRYGGSYELFKSNKLCTTHNVRIVESRR